MAKKIFEQFNNHSRKDFKNETGFTVPPPEELIHDKSIFEKIEKNEIIEIIPGIQMEKGSFSVDSNGSFVNYYDISIDTNNKNVSIDLFSIDNPIHLKRILQNDIMSVAVTNGGFFYLSDKYNQRPENSNYQLNIRKNEIHGLPVADRPFLFIKNEELCIKEIKARGTISINNTSYSWRGSQSNHSADITLYTSASTIITQEISSSTGTKRISLPTFTPKSNNMKDVVINRNKDGFLIIETVRPGGECEVQEGLGVLQIPSTIPVKAGMTIKIPKIDTLDTSSISEGFCIGPSVFYFSNNDDHEINHDSSLGSNLPFGLNRIARHVIYKDMNNKIHTRLFDGVPGSDICKGITPKEVAKIFEKMSVEWAYHLDGGQSAKIVTREQNISDMHKNIKSYGNKHYVQWPKKDSQPFLWDPDGGRKVPSGIKFQKKRDDQKQKEVLDLDTKYRVFD